MPSPASAPEATRHGSAQRRQRAQAQRARAMQWRRRYLLVVCGWCTRPIRWQRILWDAPTAATSHGFCPACFEKTMTELGKMDRG